MRFSRISGSLTPARTAGSSTGAVSSVMATGGAGNVPPSVQVLAPRLVLSVTFRCPRTHRKEGGRARPVRGGDGMPTGMGRLFLGLALFAATAAGAEEPVAAGFARDAVAGD